MVKSLMKCMIYTYNDLKDACHKYHYINLWKVLGQFKTTPDNENDI